MIHSPWVVVIVLAICLCSPRTTVLAKEELLLVQVIWRDGDHVPLKICPNDQNIWSHPWGRLTAEGMYQHQRLGSAMYQMYGIDQHFLNQTYDPLEIYVRSVDVNRTITSASSNLIGMYYNRSGEIAGLDYPDTLQWPHGYVPVPVHMIQGPSDHLLNPDADCKRRSYLMEILRGSTEFKALEMREKDFLTNISARCGESVGVMDSIFLADSYRIEKSQGKVPLFTEEEYNRLQSIEQLVIGYVNGQGVSSTDGINLSIELPRIRSGTLLTEISNRMFTKVRCVDYDDTTNGACKYLSHLRYYAYSATESMFDALLCTIGMKPQSSATRNMDASAFVFEMWRNVIDNAAFYYVKTLLIDNSSDNVKPVNIPLKGCSDYPCSLIDFYTRLLVLDPGNIDEACNKVPAAWTMTDRATIIPHTLRHFKNTSDIVQNKGQRQLIFMQAAWRHGDRNPKMICPNDNNTASTWRKGLGETTALGMHELESLGSLMYDEYVVKNKFLSPSFQSAEIYVRSTEVNRTITSALAYLVGMYANRSHEAEDYPRKPGWPVGFIPIPIHTVLDDDDVTDPHFHCTRKDDLVAIEMQTPEVQKFIADNQLFLENMSRICGKKLDMFSAGAISDTLFVEKEYDRYRIFSEEEYQQLDKIDNFVDDIYSGLLNTSEYDGYNLKVELATLGGGGFLWYLTDLMNHKITCLDPREAEKAHCVWVRDLKFYAYSARGSSLNALLSALEAKAVYPEGEAPFGSVIIFELWRDETGQYQVVMRSRFASSGDVLDNTTRFIGGCGGGISCPLETFINRSQQFNPGDLKKRCAERAFPSEVSTTEKSPTTTSAGSATVPLSFTIIALLVVQSFRES